MCASLLDLVLEDSRLQHAWLCEEALVGGVHAGRALRGFIENYVSLQQAAGHRANFDPQKSATEKGVLLKAL